MTSIIIGVLSLVLIGTGLFYFVATTGFGLVEGRRQSRAALASGRPLDGTPGDTESARRRPQAVYFLVPCLNEEGVIGSTLTHLLGNTEARVVIVDDASDDRTADIVRYVGGDRTLLISRRLPTARQGKGLALNAGLPAIVADARARGLDQSDVLVCVMDADGYLSDGALPHVLRLFEDPRVGGAQLGVRISNRKVNLLTAMQDFEFWGLAATAQMGRVRLGTVSLGGNGQFTRLSALCGLSAAPWNSALTEDLDLALRLMEQGWRLTTTPDAAVYQQAVLTLPALIRQRTRWFQGHMACIGHLRSMWGSPTMSNLALLEVSAYLLIPWVFILPWSILFHLGLWELLGRLASSPSATLGGNGLVIRGITVVAWYLLGFGPSLFGGYLYYRQDRSVGKVRSIVLGHELVLCNYVAFVSCWLAAFRSLRGLRGWEKTVRRTEGGLEYLVPPVAIAGPARVMGRLRKRVPEAPAVARSAAAARSAPVARSAADRSAAAARPLVGVGAVSVGASNGASVGVSSVVGAPAAARSGSRAGSPAPSGDAPSGGTASLPVVFRFGTPERPPAGPPPSVPSVTSPVAAPAPPTTLPTRAATPTRAPISVSAPPTGTARAIVSHAEDPAGRRPAAPATVRARVSGGTLKMPPENPVPPPVEAPVVGPALTGRLRVTPPKVRTHLSPNSLGARFLTDNGNLATVATLEEETA